MFIALASYNSWFGQNKFPTKNISFAMSSEKLK